MKLIFTILFRLITSIPVLLIFGLTGIYKLWRFGGVISVNFSKEISEPEALAVLVDVIAEYKAIKKESE